MKKQTEKTLGREIGHEEFEKEYLPGLVPEKSSLQTTNTGGMLSIFDPVLCEVLYRWFLPEKATVFDPFAGGSVRGIIAEHLGYKYTGIDLRDDQVEANYNNAREIFGEHSIKWLIGNSLKLKSLVRKKEFDFVFSCPPYFDLEQYSSDETDLSNLDWDEFKKQYAQIIQLSLSKLKQDRFACFVVSDVRDENGMYRNFVSETIEAFHKAGADLYNEIILVNVAGSLPIRINRQFQGYRKVGRMHQNVLVFYKGDPQNIKNFGNVKLPDFINNNLHKHEKQPNIDLLQN